MKELILLAAVLGMFGAGFWAVSRVDRFAARSRRAQARAAENHTPSFVVLRGPLEDAQLLEEIRRFRAGHPQMQILLCDASDPEAALDAARR